jgi:hypothetical protein
VVLGRSADHRGPADVDVLDDVGLADPAPPGRALERVEVDAHEIDVLDVVLGCGAHVPGVAADGQQAGVEPGVQRLHAAVHDLREAGEVLDAADLEARLAQLGRRAAGRDDLHPQGGKAAPEVHDAALVGDGQQRPAHPHGARLGERDAGIGGGRLGDVPRIIEGAPGKPRAMEHPHTESERDLERSGDELEERLEHLDDQIDEAKEELEERREDAASPGEEVAGDWEDESPGAQRAG